MKWMDMNRFLALAMGCLAIGLVGCKGESVMSGEGAARVQTPPDDSACPEGDDYGDDFGAGRKVEAGEAAEEDGPDDLVVHHVDGKGLPMGIPEEQVQIIDCDHGGTDGKVVEEGEGA